MTSTKTIKTKQNALITETFSWLPQFLKLADNCLLFIHSLVANAWISQPLFRLLYASFCRLSLICHLVLLGSVTCDVQESKGPGISLISDGVDDMDRLRAVNWLGSTSVGMYSKDFGHDWLYEASMYNVDCVFPLRAMPQTQQEGQHPLTGQRAPPISGGT